MHKSGNTILRKNSSNYESYLYVLTLISLPALIVAILLAVITVFTFTNSIDKNKQEAFDVLSNSSQTCEKSLNTTIAMSAFLADNSIVVPALTDANWQYREEITDLLKGFSGLFSYVDSAYIYNYKSGIVYSETGRFYDYDFFKNINSYDNYPLEYWKSIMFYHSEPYRILSPSLFSSAGSSETKSIIPIVIRKIDGLQQKNYLILNVDIKKILVAPSNDAVEVFVYNKYTNEIFYPEKYSAREKMSDIVFLQNLREHPNKTFNFRFGGEKTIISTFSANDSLVGYTYFAVISLQKLIEQELPIIFVYIAVIIIVLIFSSYITLRNTRKIYNPVKRVEATLDKMAYRNKKENKNIFEQIVSLSENIQHTNNDVLSFAQEHYLINKLNATDSYIDENSMKAIHLSFNFPCQYFAVVLIQIAPTLKFYDFYSQEMYFEIKKNFYDIIKDLFSQHFITYVLPAEEGVLEIILNFDSKEDFSLVQTVFNDVYKLMQTDREYLNLSVGIGSICTEIDNLKKSHDKAKYNFITYNQPESAAKISSDEQETILFDKNTENALYIALSSYDKQKITKTVSRIFEDNSKLSGHSVKLLYNYILNVMLRFIRINNIPYKNDMLDYEILDAFLKQPAKNIKSDMNELIDIIAASKKGRNKSEDVSEDIIKYLLKNYSSPDISIKELSSAFYVSESTVSRIIKEETGLGFRDFVNMKRIEKAKKLLENKTKSTEEIYTACGFTNSRSFYRIFKANVGQTPNEYAKLHE